MEKASFLENWDNFINKAWQVQTKIITTLTGNIGNREKQCRLDYIHYFAGGITGFICYWLTQTSYDLDQAVEALLAVTLGHGKADEISG
ncbi:TPA: hypothetical protein TY426_001325 [Streptococcus suis]|nr:hypothetical protein [Streptococcus suis]